MTVDYKSEINTINAGVQDQLRNQMQPVDAHYYSFTGDNGQLRAGLIVLLDSQQHAIRAELHFYDQNSLPAQNAVLRQSQNIVGARYAGLGLTTPLYIMESDQQQSTIQVQHVGEPVYVEKKTYPLWPFLAAVGVLTAAVLAIWIYSFFLRPSGKSTAEPAPTAAAAPAADSGITAAGAAAAGAAAAPLAGSQRAAAPAANVVMGAVGKQTNGLSASRNADSRLAVGMKVHIKPSLKSYVRSQPGMDSGDPLGVLQDGDTATVIGGPVWLQGDSDTIVWWLVVTPSGVQGWTPANTSDLTVLEPSAE